MTARANQHFVPKFYFRMFTGGDRRIHLLHKKNESIYLNANIKYQCARHRFYGSNDIEQRLSLLEGQQSSALREIRDLAWSPTPKHLEPHHLARVWEAVVLQRARTELKIEKTSPALEEMFLTMFTEHLKTASGIKDRATILAHVQSGKIRITPQPQYVATISMMAAMENRLLISDLDIHVLRNQTDYPFLFGDSPVVFCNTFYRSVTQRGVLGLQTPGLQIFYPIDSRTMIMLIDDRVYDGRYREPFLVDVHSRCDGNRSSDSVE